MNRAASIRAELAAVTRRLYDADTPEQDRRELSMRAAVLRAALARAERREGWTPDAALDAPEEE